MATPPFSPTLREFCPSDNAKTTWSVCGGIIMHYAVSSSFKHHPIPDGLIVVFDRVDFRENKKIDKTHNFFPKISSQIETA